jgi:hypothetical protein
MKNEIILKKLNKELIKLSDLVLYPPMRSRQEKLERKLNKEVNKLLEMFL